MMKITALSHIIQCVSLRVLNGVRKTFQLRVLQQMYNFNLRKTFNDFQSYFKWRVYLSQLYTVQLSSLTKSRRDIVISGVRKIRNYSRLCPLFEGTVNQHHKRLRIKGIQRFYLEIKSTFIILATIFKDTERRFCEYQTRYDLYKLKNQNIWKL